MEIERKFLIRQMPADLGIFEAKHITQGYISTDPVIRIRRTAGGDADRYTLTVKGRGLMAREELNLPLTEEAFDRLKAKIEGRIIEKTRYLIPLDGSDLVCELDVFEGDLAPLVLAEVEFASVEEAGDFAPPAWFGTDVTDDPRYQNASMSEGAQP